MKVYALAHWFFKEGESIVDIYADKTKANAEAAKLMKQLGPMDKLYEGYEVEEYEVIA